MIMNIRMWSLQSKVFERNRQMKKNGAYILLFTIMLSVSCNVFLLCCFNNENNIYCNLKDAILRGEIIHNKTNSRSSLNKNDCVLIEVANDGYKLFYGEWEVKKYLNYTAEIPMNEQDSNIEKSAESFVGMHVSYGKDGVLNNNHFVLENPIYKISIIPVLEKEQNYLGKRSLSVSSLGINGNYFNYVFADGKKQGNVFGDTFYIIDNNTLVTEYMACEYLMKRVSFIENASMYEEEHN